MGARVESVYGLSIILLATIVCITAVPVESDNKNLKVRILHVNDMHSRFEETSQHSGICSDGEAQAGKCYGGFARLATLVRNAKQSASAEHMCTLFMVAGDTFQGSRLFSRHKWQIVDKLLNILKPDVMGLGNHEFDDGVSGLAPFLKSASFPIIASNLDLTAEPSLRNHTMLIKAMSLKIGNNTRIGIVGYLTPETRILSMPGNVKFLDELTSVRTEARNLRRDGCTTIIALGHSGFEVDKKIAKEVEEVDLIIGGHTNTFLHNGPNPDLEKAEGPYPTVVEQPGGKKVYVVQAYAYTKYIGDLTLEIDEKGKIVKAEGNTLLLDKSVPKAEDVEEEVRKWASARISTAPGKDIGV